MSAPLTPEREQEIRELTSGVEHFTAPWSVDYEMTDGYWSVGYSTENPLAGLIARVPDYGLNAAFFIAESATFVSELLAEVDRLRAELAARPTRAEVLRQEGDAIVKHCPDHGPQDQDGVWMDCHCDVADEMRRMANAIGGAR